MAYADRTILVPFGPTARIAILRRKRFPARTVGVWRIGEDALEKVAIPLEVRV